MNAEAAQQVNEDMNRIASEMEAEKYAISYFVFRGYNNQKKKVEVKENQMDWKYWFSKIAEHVPAWISSWSDLYVYGMKEGDEKPQYLVEFGFIMDGETQQGAIELVRRNTPDKNAIFQEDPENDRYESLEAATMAVLKESRIVK